MYIFFVYKNIYIHIALFRTTVNNFRKPVNDQVMLLSQILLKPEIQHDVHFSVPFQPSGKWLAMFQHFSWQFQPNFKLQTLLRSQIGRDSSFRSRTKFCVVAKRNLSRVFMPFLVAAADASSDPRSVTPQKRTKKTTPRKSQIC